MNNSQYLLRYEEQLTQMLLEKCTSKGFLDGQLLEAEELTEKWEDIAPEYMVDAVPEYADYPAVAISWAAYVGMGLAAMWDGDWNKYSDKKNLYAIFRNPGGFDAMDEYIAEEFLGLKLDSKENRSIEELLCGCAHSAMAMMRNEKVEAQSTDAFYIFASTVTVFFKLGIAIELKQLGYKYEKVKIEMPHDKTWS